MIKTQSETVWIDVTGPLRETDKAYLFETDVGEEWIPKSQLKARKKTDDGQGFTRIELSRWFGEKLGLADERDKL